ncbi:uncharacterized protein LOC131246666 [Magnolia sinica]|uniref:uncharacterized protein LOC131246666 n=1 Tax=Magnolia sinica TaxID=86752 RepID=UPI0026588381|nr:uncharacterized protein LOC131246666 [Magnolia sinica]
MKLQEAHHPLHLLSSLDSQFPHIQSFKSKWSTIKSKIPTLQSHLSDLSDSPSNPLSSDLLHSLSQSLSDAISLATLCRNPSPPIGKLRTQSDLDSIAARLDHHIHDADLLIKSGVLLDNPTASASSMTVMRREAIRVEARNLITRLQIGNSDSKITAMDSLIALLRDDDKNVLIAVAQGAVPVLVRLLDSSCSEIKEKAVSVIARISTVDSSKHVLVAEGILLLNHLLRVLESGSGFAKEKACSALQALSFTKENARAIGSRGGVSSLLEICQGGTPASQAVAAGVLRNLAGVPEIHQNFIDENAVIVLIGLAASGTFAAQENAIGCLCNLVSENDDDSLKVLVMKEGGIECLKNYWDGTPAGRSLEVAIGLLRNLCSCRSVADVLASVGFVPRAVGALNCGAVTVRIAAARAVHELAFSGKTRKEMGECGCISNLVRMLDAKAIEEREVAAKVLSSVLLFAGNRRIFRKEERGVESVVQLLDPTVRNLEKKYPISILTSVSQSKKCRKRMIAAGACVFLQKLAEMEVEGAKKLLENLGRGKLWGVFGRT